MECFNGKALSLPEKENTALYCMQVIKEYVRSFLMDCVQSTAKEMCN